MGGFWSALQFLTRIPVPPGEYRLKESVVWLPVVGLVCVVALKIAAVYALPTGLRPHALALAPTLGRWAIVLLATGFPYGREHGLGAPLKVAATPRTLALASLLPLAGCITLGPVGIVCGLLATVVALGLGRWLMRLLPGLTGDNYGAACEL